MSPIRPKGPTQEAAIVSSNITSVIGLAISEGRAIFWKINDSIPLVVYLVAFLESALLQGLSTD